MKQTVIIGFAIGIAIVCVILSAGMTQAKEAQRLNMAQPQYNGDGQLLRPTNYREWVFVGASLGLSYNEPRETGADEGPGRFHHVYIQPQAYRQYADTGEFPEKTILVMENYSAAGKEGINLQGHFEKDRVGLEVAVKDSDHVEETWAYYNFTVRDGTLKPAAKAFPKAVCWQCHKDHAADDNVFVQFYPILREAKPSLDLDSNE